jgi:hypothetical protein
MSGIIEIINTVYSGISILNDDGFDYSGRHSKRKRLIVRKRCPDIPSRGA